MRRIVVALALVASLGGAPVAAQSPELAAPFVTVDQERLFAESAFGRRAIAEIDQRSRTLAAENRRIEAELVAEERALTELRPTLLHAEFRTRAEAFDEKVQRLRAEQDEKELEVSALRDQAQSVFFGRIGPVLGEVVGERGAVAILDRRAVILAIESIDVTDAAIARIDAVLGDGAGVWPTNQAAGEPVVEPPAAAEVGSAALPLARPETDFRAQPPVAVPDSAPSVAETASPPNPADGAAEGEMGNIEPVSIPPAASESGNQAVGEGEAED